MPNDFGKFSESLKIHPIGSQVVIVVLSLVLAMCLYYGFRFLELKSEDIWVPFIAAAVLLISIIYLWLKSHKNVDAGPVTSSRFMAQIDDQIVLIETDPRTLESEDNISLFERILSTVRHRRSLPEPAGLVDDNGEPVPNSKGEAETIVKHSNERVDRMRRLVLSLFDKYAENNDDILPIHDLPEKSEAECDAPDNLP